MSNNTISGKDLKRLRGILMPAFSGKTSQIQDLNKYQPSDTDRNCIFIDADEISEKDQKPTGESFIHLFPAIKDKVIKFLKNYVKYEVYVMSSQIKLLEFLRIPNDKIVTFVPSQSLWLNILLKSGMLEKPSTAPKPKPKPLRPSLRSSSSESNLPTPEVRAWKKIPIQRKGSIDETKINSSETEKNPEKIPSASDSIGTGEVAPNNLEKNQFFLDDKKNKRVSFDQRDSNDSVSSTISNSIANVGFNVTFYDKSNDTTRSIDFSLEEELRNICNSRDDIMRRKNNKTVIMYDSFDDLNNQIVKITFKK